MSLAAGEDFLNFFRHMREGAFRLELRDRYNVAAEQDRWNAFVARDWERLEELNRRDRAVWMQLIGEATAAGKAVERVRVVSEPPPSYIQFEMLLNAGNAQVGEDIRYLPRQQAAGLDLPALDYWMFDQHTAVVLHFDDDDVLTRMELVDDPTSMAAFRAGQQTAWAAAVTYEEYVKKWADLAEPSPGT
ncbi:DUF6879 family protein [Nonomuraea sp. NPDC050536]|uniref:DUF6879 family protein n=1 Tax=Nonomuraea sp. NPDC050536 TaxID=3364366 RepID=UPI0037C61284